MRWLCISKHILVSLFWVCVLLELWHDFFFSVANILHPHVRVILETCWLIYFVAFQLRFGSGIEKFYLLPTCQPGLQRQRKSATLYFARFLSDLVKCEIRKGLEKSATDNLVIGLLFVRQATLEGSHIFPSYTSWFQVCSYVRVIYKQTTAFLIGKIVSFFSWRFG